MASFTAMLGSSFERICDAGLLLYCLGKSKNEAAAVFLQRLCNSMKRAFFEIRTIQRGGSRYIFVSF